LVEEFLTFLEVERNASPRTVRIYRTALRDFQDTDQRPGGGNAGRNIFEIISST
jgi:site-specific recombinase XerD